MIISHKHKFIFIKTQKTAGTSIEIALSKICGTEDIITPISQEDEIARKELGYKSAQNYLIPKIKYSRYDWLNYIFKGKKKNFYNHISALEIRNMVEPKIWEDYFKFTFERNPYDKIVSYYYYSGKSQSMGIGDFIKSGILRHLKGYDQYSIGGIPVVDKIYNFENIEGAFEDISSRLALNEPLRLPSYRAKAGFRKKSKKYCEILNVEDSKIIDQIYAREFKLLKYKF